MADASKSGFCRRPFVRGHFAAKALARTSNAESCQLVKRNIEGHICQSEEYPFAAEVQERTLARQDFSKIGLVL